MLCCCKESNASSPNPPRIARRLNSWWECDRRRQRKGKTVARKRASICTRVARELDRQIDRLVLETPHGNVLASKDEIQLTAVVERCVTPEEIENDEEAEDAVEHAIDCLWERWSCTSLISMEWDNILACGSTLSLLSPQPRGELPRVSWRLDYVTQTSSL